MIISDYPGLQALKLMGALHVGSGECFHDDTLSIITGLDNRHTEHLTIGMPFYLEFIVVAMTSGTSEQSSIYNLQFTETPVTIRGSVVQPGR